MHSDEKKKRVHQWARFYVVISDEGVPVGR